MPVNYHTHTFRCGHAENAPDEAYLQRAIEQGFLCYISFLKYG